MSLLFYLILAAIAYIVLTYADDGKENEKEKKEDVPKNNPDDPDDDRWPMSQWVQSRSLFKCIGEDGSKLEECDATDKYQKWYFNKETKAIENLANTTKCLGADDSSVSAKECAPADPTQAWALDGDLIKRPDSDVCLATSKTGDLMTTKCDIGDETQKWYWADDRSAFKIDVNAPDPDPEPVLPWSKTLKELDVVVEPRYIAPKNEIQKYSFIRPCAARRVHGKPKVFGMYGNPFPDKAIGSQCMVHQDGKTGGGMHIEFLHGKSWIWESTVDDSRALKRGDDYMCRAKNESGDPYYGHSTGDGKCWTFNGDAPLTTDIKYLHKPVPDPTPVPPWSSEMNTGDMLTERQWPSEPTNSDIYVCAARLDHGKPKVPGYYTIGEESKCWVYQDGKSTFGMTDSVEFLRDSKSMVWQSDKDDSRAVKRDGRYICRALSESTGAPYYGHSSGDGKCWTVIDDLTTDIKYLHKPFIDPAPVPPWSSEANVDDMLMELQYDEDPNSKVYPCAARRVPGKPKVPGYLDDNGKGEKKCWVFQDGRGGAGMDIEYLRNSKSMGWVTSKDDNVVKRGDLYMCRALNENGYPHIGYSTGDGKCHAAHYQDMTTDVKYLHPNPTQSSQPAITSSQLKSLSSRMSKIGSNLRALA
jgi:hypothetical protein